MKAIVLESIEQLRLVEMEQPDHPGPNEALVRVLRVGICGTDLHAFEGKQPFFSYPRILGHELALEVEALGSSNRAHQFQVGDRCTVEPYLNCGKCLACLRGRPNCCVNLQVLGVHRDGGMREWFTVPIGKLHHADNVPVESLALVEMFSIGAHAVRRAQLESGENTLVIGAGPIGMGTMRFARLMGANVVAMDVNLERLAFCQKHIGVAAIVDARQDAEQQVRDRFNGELPTAVFDATGNAKSMANAFNFVAHSGRLIFVGLVQDNVAFHDPLFHSREMTLLATRNATPADFAWVLTNMTAGKLDTTAWITHLATPEVLVEQFASWLLPGTGVIKAMLTFD
jgi:2-desacetyl-2-hydroxyethyl bacteriochlorophyllide A dehydrogenase